MTETTKTDTTPAGVAAHALRALVDHFDYKFLPAPLSVTITDRDLLVQIPAEGAERWAVTLAKGSGVICLGSGDVAHFRTSGLLPDTGVRVRLMWSRASSAAVPA